MSLISKRSKDLLTSIKIEDYNIKSKMIKFWRKNPIIACEQLLGIKLLDNQKYMLQMSWNCPNVLWACS